MAVNKLVGDNARKGAVRKRSQRETKIQGEDTWTKRSGIPAASWIRKGHRPKSPTKAFAKKNDVWLVQVRSPDDPSDRRCFCAFTKDETLRDTLVKGYVDFDSLIIEPLALLPDDVAQGIIEVYGLVPGGVLPWPAKGR